MDRNKLIEVFKDTLKISRCFDCNVRVYHEKFTSVHSALICSETKVDAKIIVENNTTFSAANKYKTYGKTAVLNFANPVNPGGGVATGAMAQEECLCRSSNLI